MNVLMDKYKEALCSNFAEQINDFYSYALQYEGEANAKALLRTEKMTGVQVF